MKRQKLKVFNSCRHSSTMNSVSENKLFTVLLNRRAMFGIALLLSTLLPLNQAAPMAKSSIHSDGSQTETTSVASPPPSSSTVPDEALINSTVPTEQINGEFVSSPVGSDAAAAAVPSSSSTEIEKMLSNNKESSIEYNHNVATIKSDSVRVTTFASIGSTNNYLDENNHSVSPINIMISASQPSTLVDAVDKKIIADAMAESASTLPTTTAARDEDVVTTTTFVQHSHSSQSNLPDSQFQHNKNPTQETIFTAENSVQTTKATTILSDFTTVTAKLSSDSNATPSLPTSSLTEIDGLLPNANTTQHFNEPTSVQSEASNLFSTEPSTQTNDNDKNHGVAAADIPNENKKPFEATVDSDLGHSEATQAPVLDETISTTDNPNSPVAITITPTNNHGGKIAKVFDEEKSSGKKVNNNNKKYNNKNNKDKLKKKTNEEGGVYDPNGKLNDNLLMAAVSSTQEPIISSIAMDIGAAGAAAAVHTTTIRSMETHSIDGNSFDKNKADILAFDEIHTESVTNADVTNFAPSASVANAHIPSSMNGTNSEPIIAIVATTTEFSPKTDSTQVESTIPKDKIVDEKPASTTLKPDDSQTKELISEITSTSEKQMLTEKPEVTNIDNELMRTTDNANNDIKTTIKPTPLKPSILDYDKSSEEIFDIVHETSTSKAELSSVAQKRPLNSPNDEFFLPADDLDTDATASAPPPTTTTTTTTTAQSTVSINTESSIVRPSTDGLDPTITVPIPIVTSDTKPQQPNTDPNKASTISRDSDTIFYISNTEVKVVESSVPTPNSKQENQFFPALFEEDVIIDFPGKNTSGWNTGLDGAADKYEEDIILSPMKSNFDPTKLNDENLSISYVGESFIDIKEATSDDMSSGSDSNAQTNDISSESRENARSFGDNAISSNVIIEPVVIPDVQQSIGVPIIGALPSQINIRDLDYKNDAIQLNNSGNSISSHFPTHPGDNLQKERELTAELPKTDSEEAITFVDDDKIDMGKNETQKSSNTTTAAEAITNVTAYSSVLDEDPEANWNDIQTIIVIALLTIVPSIGCLILIFAIRKVYRKAISLRDGSSSGKNGNVLLRDSSTDPLAMNSHTISTDELKSVDCEANGINHSNDNLISSAEMTVQCDERAAGHAGQMNHHSGANGSLITMTMKNNHLIVETEERSDIARDVRETKVHYSPSEKDGVFVVEVARGADSNTTPIMANIANAAMTMEQMSVSPRQTQATIVEVAEEQPKSVDYASSNDGNVSCTRSNEKVLVHPPPNGMEEDVLMIDEDGAVSMSSPSKHNGLDEACGGVASAGNINTGLSQSDLSISSSDGSNRAYSYGQQEPYTVESKTYQSTSPHRSIAPIALGEPVETIEPLESIETGIPTPEPITVISDTEHENQINENESPEITTEDTFKPEPLSDDTINDNQIPTTDNGIILAKALKTVVEIENGNENQNGNSNGNGIANENGNGNEADHEHDHHHQQNGFKTQSMITTNGKLNGFNGNEHLTDDSNDFDSLMNLPAPPTCDEIKQFNDISTLDNGNMDSLPPPPPEIHPATAGPINVES